MDLRKALLYLSIFAGLTYFLATPWQPFPGSIVLKGLSVSALAALAWISLERGGRNRALLTGALALSSLGDILLDLSSAMFVFGLGSFLLAHICYIQLFLGLRRKGESLGAIRWILTVALAAFSVSFSWWLMPFLGGLAPAVMAYVGVLTAMIFSSLAWKASTPWVSAGAFLFLISDAALGASRFHGAVPLRGWIVWGTYYAAQYLIANGTLRELETCRPYNR